MDFYTTVNRRRTIRDLEDTPIPTEVLHRILDAGLKAPTNDHLRNWAFVVIADPTEKARIIQKIPKSFSNGEVQEFIDSCNMSDPIQRAMYMQAVPKQYGMLYHSGCLVLPFFRQAHPLLKPKSINDLNGFASIWCCIENIFLAAAAEGLGTAFRIPFPEESAYLKEAVGHPDEYVMPCYIAIGYPKEDAGHTVQHEYRAADKIHINRW